MEWKDKGVILSTKRHGERSVIAQIMTQNHGRHYGMIRSGRSVKMQPLLQIGNKVEVSWWARLDEHLGQFEIEPEVFYAARAMEHEISLNALQLVTHHLTLLPERDPHENLFEALLVILENLDHHAKLIELIALFEIMLLSELGFGLDLSQCAATGVLEDLIYVSPKSGRAVSRSAGEPWKHKLLTLPQFLQCSSVGELTQHQAHECFMLTYYFLNLNVYHPRNIEPPIFRTRFTDFINQILVQ